MKLGNLTEVVRLNENEPGGKRERYFESTQGRQADLRKMMARHIPTGRRAREAGLLGAGRELVQGREHRLCAATLCSTTAPASTTTSIQR